MSAASVQVTLRYRPAADVLTGRVELPADADAHRATVTVTESPDADTTFEWTVAAGDGPAMLASFQVVFADARLRDGTLPLPASLAPAVRSLVDVAQSSLDGVDDQLVRMRAKGEATTTVPLESLRRDERPELTPRRQALDRRAAARLSHSLSRLADAVHQRVPVDDEVEALHTDHLARLLRELSTTITAQHGRTSPGVTASGRAAVRDVVTLTADEVRALDQALTDLDDPEAWPRLSRRLERLTAELHGSGHRPT